MTSLGLPNPGYPEPRGVKLILKSGVMMPVETRFVDVITDRGVPTPRFQVVLPEPFVWQGVSVDALDVGFWPPGTIIMFPQAGDAAENAERISELSNRRDKARFFMSRRDQR